MQAWIYSPLQRIASDSGMKEGREGMEHTGVGGKMKTVSIARRSSNKGPYEDRIKEGL